MASLRIVLRQGALEAQRTGALIVSANDALVGNDQPEYWRFNGRTSADGAVRDAAGPELAAAAAAVAPLPSSAVRRDIVRWTGGVKRGRSAPVRCPTGTAVATQSFGRLECDTVVHAVAPDVELTYGRYTGEYADSADDRDVLPEQLLLGAYTEAFRVAGDEGASSAACPALGCGVKGWLPAVSAAFGLQAAVRSTLEEAVFVLDGDSLAAWVAAASWLLPAEARGACEQAPVHEWTLDAATRRRPLPIKDLTEFNAPRATWATEAAGTQTAGGNWRWQPSYVRAVS